MTPTALRSAARGSISLIGPGRLGQALGRLLTRAGYPIGFVASRRLKQARRAVAFIGSGRAVNLSSPETTQASVILLTTTDRAIGPLAERLAARKEAWRGKVVLHTCGSLPASVLQPLARRGAAIGSIHPFQTIPDPATGARNLVGCFWAIEGGGAARRVALRWVRALGGVSFPVKPSQKGLYHLAAFLVCPTIVTLMEQAFRLLRRLGVRPLVARAMLRQFVAETAGNFANLGGRRALTGPAVRGDWQTLRGHLQLLRRNTPELVPAYMGLLELMFRLAGRKPRGPLDTFFRDPQRGSKHIPL